MECFMIIANPGENANTEINISWHTDLDNTNCKLLFTKIDDINFEKAGHKRLMAKFANLEIR